MMGPMDIGLWMWHEAEDPACLIAYPCHAVNGAIGVEGILQGCRLILLIAIRETDQAPLHKLLGNRRAGREKFSLAVPHRQKDSLQALGEDAG
jgi:hypothetical protein